MITKNREKQKVSVVEDSILMRRNPLIFIKRIMLKSFIVEQCQMSPDYCVIKAEFYEAYCHFERSHGRQPVHINEICRRMKELDFAEARTKNKRFWAGVRLIGLDVAATSEDKENPLTPSVPQSASVRNDSTLEETLNQRLRQDLHGGWTYRRY